VPMKRRQRAVMSRPRHKNMQQHNRVGHRSNVLLVVGRVQVQGQGRLVVWAVAAVGLMCAMRTICLSSVRCGFENSPLFSQLLYRHVQNDDDLPRQARDEQQED
jgi:hypothetical protein